MARLFTTLAIIQTGIEPADAAVRLSPADPQTHYTRALSLVNLERLPEAVTELRQAIQIRPHHYYQWLDLGVTLDRLGDEQGAVGALMESVRLAPSYAQPRWQLGNLLFRQGRYEEAFEDLRSAARSDSTLSESLLRLGWLAADGDVARFEALVRPETSKERFRVAAFLSREGHGPEVVAQVKSAGIPSDDVEALFLHQTIDQLLIAQAFNEAYMVWAITHPPSSGEGPRTPGQVVNGNFAGPIFQNEPGFGWRLTPIPNITTSIDPSGPSPGGRSIRIDYQGESPPLSQPIHQLVLIEKNGRYILKFQVKTQQLMSGGPPRIAIFDQTHEPRLLDRSLPLAPGTAEWKSYEVDFDVAETALVQIGLQREICPQNPCPIFGTLWLGDFSLVRK